MTDPAESPEAKAAPQIEPRASRFRTIRRVLFALLVLVLLVRVQRFFFYEGFRASAPNMAPTLFAGEHFLVKKSAYGIRAHRTPERGDVIVFPSPEHPEEDYVERVIGLPGDTIRIERGVVFINEWRLPSCVAGLATLPVQDQMHVGVVMVELLGSTAYLVFHEDTPHHHEDESSGDHQSQGPYTVSANEVFVLGDSRENSHDSRFWFEGRGGGVPIATIRGRASTIWRSADSSRLVWSRVGTSLTGTPKCPEQVPTETCKAVEKCLASRPPLDVTTPPAAP
jgi:signal peptidase I